MYIANKTWKNNTKGFFGKKLGLEILSDNVFSFSRLKSLFPLPPLFGKFPNQGGSMIMLPD